MNKKAPVFRVCIVSRELLPLKDLYKVTRVKSTVYFDKEQNLKGRGAYIKKDLSTILLAQKRHSLSKALKIDVDDSIYLELIQALSKERR